LALSHYDIASFFGCSDFDRLNGPDDFGALFSENRVLRQYNWQFRSIRRDQHNRQREQTLGSLRILPEMPVNLAFSGNSI
jgi:hypothetical protein